MKLEIAPGNMWKVEPDPALLGSATGLRRPFYITSTDAAKALLFHAEMNGETRQGARITFPIPVGAKLESICNDMSIVLSQVFPATDSTILVRPAGLYETNSPARRRWEAEWKEWILDRVEESSTSVYYRLPVRLPVRKWTAKMTLGTWGQGFIAPKLQVFREADYSRNAASAIAVRWLGGNMGTGHDLCWGTYDTSKPLATLESFDSMFFQTSFNEDLQLDSRRWHMMPDSWGLAPGIARIPESKLTSRTY